MKKVKATPFFTRTEKPVRSGLYQCQSNETNRMYWSFFNVETGKWGMMSDTQEGAIGWRDKPSAMQYRRWRGMLKDG